MKKAYRKLDLILFGIFIVVFLASSAWLIVYQVDAKQNLIKMEKLAEKMETVPAKTPKPQTVRESAKESVKPNTAAKPDTAAKPKILSQFTKLYAQNSDIMGWIYIDGTNINYPVMFTPQDGEYYLHRNFQKDKEKRGVPFLDAGTDIEQSPNYLIYGHNMKDGTAFRDLLKYQEESYYKKHPLIHFNTLYEISDYDILAVFPSQIYYENEKTFKYYQYTGALDENQFNEYVKQVKSLSLYDTGVTAYYGEQLLTLSTCSYHVEDGRFVVVAKQKTQE